MISRPRPAPATRASHQAGTPPLRPTAESAAGVAGMACRWRQLGPHLQVPWWHQWRQYSVFGGEGFG